MATSVENLFDKLSGSFWNAGVTFERTNPVPLEKYSVFQTKEAADDYALTNVVAYPGQPVAVVNNTAVTMYYIDQNGKLVEIGSAQGAAGEVSALSAQIFGEGKLSSRLYDKIETDDAATLLSAKNYTDEVSGNYLTAYTEPISTAVSSILSDYTTSAEASAIADEYVKTLDVDAVTADTAKMVNTVSETDGKISVTFRDLTIAEVSGLEDRLTAVEKVADDATTSAETSAIASAYADAQLEAAKTYTNQVSASYLTAYTDKISTAVSSILSDYTTSAKVSAIAQDYAESAVNEAETYTRTVSADYLSTYTKPLSDLAEAATTSAEASVIVGQHIDKLTASYTAGANQYVSAITETSGVVSAAFGTLPAEIVYSISAVTPEGDSLSTYRLTKDGTPVGASINIPKDKVISSAYVVDVKGLKSGTELTAFEVSYDGKVQKTVDKATQPELFAAINQAYTGTGGGDGKYLRITVTNDEALPIYIALPELVDTYTGAETETVSVAVNADTRAISAVVKTGSIGAEHLTTALSNEITAIRELADAATTSAEASAIAAGYATSALNLAETFTNTMSAAYKEAYTDKISTAVASILSDYTTSSEVSTVAGGYATSALGLANTHADAASAEALSEAKTYTNDVSGDYLSTYTKPISTAVSSILSDYTTSAEASAIASAFAGNQLDEAKKYTRDVSADYLSTYTEPISAKVEKILSDYTTSATVSAVAAAYATSAVAPILSDYTTSAEASAIADSYVKTLDATVSDAIVDSVVSSIVEEDGKLVSMGKAKIQIAEAQVTNLTSDLGTLSNHVDNKLKVMIGDTTTAATSVDTVTIHKISQAKYAELLTTEGGIVDTDIYIVSSEYLDAYGAKVVNVAPGTVSSDAATYGQLTALGDNMLSGAKKYTNDVSAAFKSTYTDKISTAVSSILSNYTTSAQVSTVAGDFATSALGLANTHADAASAQALSDAKAYTDQVSAAYKDAYTDKISALAEAATTSAEVSAIAQQYVNTLDAPISNLTGSEVLASIKEENGVIAVETRKLSVTDLEGYSNLTSNISSKLSVTLSTVTATEGYLSSYAVMQGGVQVGDTINIPKDKVIESAEVVNLSAGEVEGLSAGTYLKISVDNVEDPLYVPVPTLVNTYSGLTSDTVAVTVGDGSAEKGYKISADVRDESITQAKLSGEFYFNCGNANGYETETL